MALLKANTGIGTTNPTSALHVIGDGLFTGIVTATTFNGNINSGVGTITTFTSTNSTITNLTNTNLSSGVGTITTLRSTTGIITNLTGVAATITYITNTNLTSGVGTITTLVSSASSLVNIYSTGISTFGTVGINSNLIVSGITILGITTATNVTAQNLNISGIATLGVTTATDVNVQNLNVSGISTFNTTKTVDLYVSGISTLGITTATDLTAQSLKISGISTLDGTNISNLYVSGITTLGIVTATDITGQNLKISGISTLGITTATDLTAQSLKISGISTLDGTNISNLYVTGISTLGIVTATDVNVQNLNVSGISTFNTTKTVDLYVSGISTLGITTATDINVQNLNVSGISTFNTTKTVDLYVSGISTLGVTTATNVNVQNLNVSGISTFNTTKTVDLYVTGITTLGVTTATDITGQNLKISGITTLGVAELTNLTAQQLNISGVSTISVNSANSALRITQEGNGNALTVEDSTNPDNSPFIITSDGKVGIGTTTTNKELFVIGSGEFTNGVTAPSFTGALIGLASSATQLQNPRTFQITGDVVASAVVFDGTGNVSLAATIQPNSVALGNDTTGDYVQTISGTTNQITVTSGTGEGSTPTISLPSNIIAPGNITVTNDLQVNNNLNVTGNITIGGTAAYLVVDELKIKDKDLVVGIVTDAYGNDVSNDTTANHGGIAVASTEGSPLVQFSAGIESTPHNYKKIMWFKSGSWSGLNTDAWLFNYGVGIGSTQIPNGVRLAVGGVQITDTSISAVSGNYSGIVTANSFVSSGGYIKAADGTNALYMFSGTGDVSFQGKIIANQIRSNTNINPTITINDLDVNFGRNATFAGIVTANTFVGNLTGTATTSTNVIGGIGSITELSVSGITTLGVTTATHITAQNLKISGISTLGVTTATNVNVQNLSVSGISTFNTTKTVDLYVTGITTLGVTTATDLTAKSLKISGISTLDGTNIGNLYVTGISTLGVTTVTDLTGQNLKISGISTLGFTTISNNLYVSGVVTATTFNGNINAGIVTVGAISAGGTTGTNQYVLTSTGTGLSWQYITGTGAITGINIAPDSTNATKYLTFVSGAGSTAIEYISVDKLTFNPSTGNLGIGTDFANTRLQVNGVIGFTTTNNGFYDSLTIRIGDGSTGSGSGADNNNIFIGKNSGSSLTNGSYNLFVGQNSGEQFLSGGSNTFIGPYAGYASTAGSNNVALGYYSGYYTSGNSNVFLGYNAGFNVTSGSDNVVIGSFMMDLPINSGSNQLIIGSNGTAWIYGNSSYNVGLGTTNPTSKLHIVGDAIIGDVKINSGIITSANPGISTVVYYGDGSKLFGVNAFNVINQNINDTIVYPTLANNTGVSSVGIASTGLVYLPSSGNLGIGSTNPTSKLTVSGDVLISGSTTIGNVRITSSGIITSTNPGISTVVYYGDGSKLFGVNAFNVINQGINDTIVYPTFANNSGVSSVGIASTGFVYLPSSGNVGIASTQPAYKLDVVGDINSSTAVRVKGVDILEDALRLAIALG